jgi:hypothetical protein
LKTIPASFSRKLAGPQRIGVFKNATSSRRGGSLFSKNDLLSEKRRKSLEEKSHGLGVCLLL